MKTLKRYSRILLTTDGSKFADLATPHAILLAKAFEAEIIVLQTVESISMINTRLQTPRSQTTGIMMETITDVYDFEKKSAEKNLKKIQKKLTEAGAKKSQVIVAEGDPKEEIVTIAKEQKCDLIVMSTHGRTGISRAILGSVADDVLRNAKCPILLIHTQKVT